MTVYGQPQRRTASWAAAVYLLICILGWVTPTGLVWPGAIAMTLQIWQTQPLVMVIILIGLVCLVAGEAMDKWRGVPPSLGVVVRRACLVVLATIVLSSFFCWNFAMWMGWPVGV